MAGRIRSIKPELREHAPLAVCTDGARLLFAMLYTLVDDEGRAPAGARYLGGAVFFGRPRSPKVVDGYVAELESAGMIATYTAADGGRYLEVTGWALKGSVTHQRIDKPQPGRYPAPIPVHSANVPGIVLERSGTDLRPPTETTDQEVYTRARARHPDAGGIARRTWEHGAKVRAELAASNVAVPPWALMPGTEHSGWKALLDRVCEQLVDSTPEAAERVCRNRVDVAAAKAREDGGGQWFASTAMFTRNSFDTFAELDPKQVGRKRSSRSTIAAGSAPPSNNFGTEMRLPGMARAEGSER